MPWDSPRPTVRFVVGFGYARAVTSSPWLASTLARNAASVGFRSSARARIASRVTDGAGCAVASPLAGTASIIRQTRLLSTRLVKLLIVFIA